MSSILRQVLRWIGVDAAIFYTVLARGTQAIGGFISVLFIAKFLTNIEQGYYYTFGSILAIQIFFELGFTGIITQYVAHEAVHLHWNKDDLCVENSETIHLARLSSLLRLVIKWFTVAACVLFVVLAIAGWLFFSANQSNGDLTNWWIPWLLLCFTTSLGLFISPILAFLEGLGKVKEVAKIRLTQQTVQIITNLSLLAIGCKLFSNPIAVMGGLVVTGLWIVISNYQKWFRLVYKTYNPQYVISYKNEIFPYQWRIALSWISGYFIFQLFNPVLFATSGAIVAGQMGMTLAVLNGISSLSMSWVTTKVPLFSGLIAQRDYKILDKVFNKTKIQLLFICICGLLVFVVGVYLFDFFHYPIRNRFLEWFPLILMCFTVFINQLVFSWATYLRCHKKEPFLAQSVTMGILCCLSTIIFGKLYGVIGITIGYAFLTIFVGFPWAFKIYKNKKILWHQVKSY